MGEGRFEGAGPEARFKAFLEEGKFMIQQSASDGSFVFYPRVVNPKSGEANLQWVEASGRGVVYATTVNRQRPEKGGDYNVALVDLLEGPRMMARVVGIDPDKVTIGLKVKARVGEINGEAAVLFEPIREGR